MTLSQGAANAALRTTARMLIENRDRMLRAERDHRAAARAAGHDIDTRIQYAEGSAAAYSVACAILAGAAGVASVQDLAGAGWTPPKDPLPPMLPVDDAGEPPTQITPGDSIGLATVIHNRACICTKTDQIAIGCPIHDPVHYRRHPDDVSTYGPTAAAIADAGGDFVPGVDFEIRDGVSDHG